jgi:hypothetical protein
MGPPLVFLAPRNPSAHRALQFILTMPGAMKPAWQCLDLAHRYSHMIDSMGFALSRARPPLLPRGPIHRSLIAHCQPAISLLLSCQLGGLDHLLIPFTAQPSTKIAASPYWMSNLSRTSRCGQTYAPSRNLGDVAARPD